MTQDETALDELRSDADQLARGWDEQAHRYEALQRDFSEFVEAIARAVRYPVPTNAERWADALNELPDEVASVAASYRAQEYHLIRERLREKRAETS